MRVDGRLTPVAAIFLRDSSLRPRMNTLAAPLAAKACAIDAPRPEPPPVTTKTMSLTENKLVMLNWSILKFD